MTTDTKVGLIVGLAFIVVFAIILSNRGQQSQLAPPLVNLVDADAPLDALRPTAGRDAGTTSLFAPTQDEWPDRDDSLVDRPMTRIFEPPASQTEPDRAGAASPQQSERRQPAALPERTRDAVPAPLDAPTLPPVRSDRPTHVAELPRSTATGVKTRVVQKGDLLAKVAKEAYGSDAKGLVDALAAYNGLKSPDHIVIGQKLRIPPIDALAAGVGAARPPVTAPPEATRPEVPEKTYVVQAGDTLTSIARSQLGSTNRWRELQTLNKLDDPNHLVEGMTLKLPPASVAAATRTRTE